MPARSAAPSSSSRRSTPYCSTAARRPIDARRPAVPFHTPPRLLEDVTLSRSDPSGHESVAPGIAGRDPESALQLAHVVDGRRPTGVIGTGRAGHALARACAANVTTAGTLRSPRVVRREAHHYYGPLGHPLRTARFRDRLIRVARPRPGPRRRASRVPSFSVHACCAPYPAETSRADAPGLGREAWPSPRHDRLGSRVVTVTRLQASLHVAARVPASSVEAPDTPLEPPALSTDARGLLLGAPGLTETGLAPAGDEQRKADAILSASSRRTMFPESTARRGGSCGWRPGLPAGLPPCRHANSTRPSRAVKFVSRGR